MTSNTSNDITVSDVYALAKILRSYRAWHYREQYRYPLHPVVVEAIGLARPVNWHQLVLEWPHRSTERHDEIAYTRDEGKGRADVQTRTGAGKYLARHWPKLPSNVLRDLVAAHVAKMEGSCKFLEATTEEIVRSVQEGPVSCMQWGEDELEDGGTNGHHPYEVYAPELGWRAAVRTNPAGQIIGRALVHDGTHMRNGHDKNKPVFVRSYKCYNDIHGTTEYSHADEKLEAWLEKQGVKKCSSWPCGTPFKHIDNGGNSPLLPYLDGSGTQVSCTYRGVHYRIDDDDEDGYNCFNTDGTADSVDAESSSYCDRCGNGFDEDDLRYIEDEEIRVCEHCLGQRYTNTSEHGYVRDEYVAQTLCGEYTWDERHDPPDSVRVLDAGRYEGGWAHEDDVVSGIDGEYWHVDDIGTEEGCIVRLCDDSHRAGEYAPVEDSVQVEGEWYHREADVEHDIIVLCNKGANEGEYALADMHEVIGLGDPESCGTWHKADEWSALEPCRVASVGYLRPPARGSYFVYLHEFSEFAGEAVDIVDAVLAPDVGWFVPMDEAAGNIVRIMDDVYALASDLVAV